MGKTPRPHQLRAVPGLQDGFRTGRRRGLLAIPTGGGKTFVSWMMAEGALAKGRRVVFVADRRVLVEQAAVSAKEFGLPVGIVMSDAPFGWRDPAAPLQVMSKDTAVAWLRAADRGERRPDLPPGDLLITDECHRSSGESWAFLRAAYPNAWEVGLSATPVFPNGRGLGERYEFMVQPTTYEELFGAGVLVRPVYHDPPTGRADRKAGKKPTRATMTGDAVVWWRKFADGLRTFCYASSVAHSEALCSDFRLAGVPAEHLDGDTGDDERRAMFGRLKARETLVVCNCNVAVYGVDLPEAECCQILRAMGSVVDYRQAVGRVMRAADDKTGPVVVDHAGATSYHGYAHAELPWTLDAGTDHGKVQRERMERGDAPKPISCPECHTLYSGSRQCPGCGWQPKRLPKRLATAGGILTRIEDGSRKRFTPDDYVRAWRRAVHVAANKGRTFSAAAAMFKKETGELPFRCGAALPGMPPAGPDWHRPVKDVWAERGDAA